MRNKMRMHIKKQTIDDCNNTTGNKVDDDGNGATGYNDDDNDNGDGR